MSSDRERLLRRSRSITQLVTTAIPQPWSPALRHRGNTLATSRCDFNTAVGTLRWAAGDSSAKTFTVLINQDAYVEGPESLPLTLSNIAGGASLSVPSAATLTIADDLTEPATNLINDTEDFVRQHYHDFLNREADASGLAFWKDNIDKCNDPARRPAGLSVAQCIEVFRINTSAAFFLSIEFQATRRHCLSHE